MYIFAIFKRKPRERQAQVKAYRVSNDTAELLEEALKLAQRRKVVIRRRIQE